MSAADTTFTPPRCVFVTGPRGPAKSRWLETRIAALRDEAPGARIAVLLADEGLTRTSRFADVAPAVAVRCAFMPCLCCPAAAELPRVARQFARETCADWLFIEVPALAAANLLAEFDAVVRWPREVVVCLSREWARAHRAQTLSVFQQRLIELADETVEPPPRCHEPADTPAAVPALTLA